MSAREIVVDSSLQRHQVKRFLALQRGVQWSESVNPSTPGQFEFRFTISATDKQWEQIQDWVKKVTG